MESSILKEMRRMHWNWSVSHVETEAEISVAVCFVGSLSRLGEELTPVLLDFAGEFCRQFRVTRICKKGSVGCE